MLSSMAKGCSRNRKRGGGGQLGKGKRGLTEMMSVVQENVAHKCRPNRSTGMTEREAVVL